MTLAYRDSYTIVVFDRLDYAGSLNNIRQLQGLKNFHFFYGDICNRHDVDTCITRFRIDTILHFAAQSHVARSFENALDFTSTNVIGTHILLESARKASMKCFFYVSTDEVYGEPMAGERHDPEDCAEGAPLQPNNPYSATKAAAEMLVRAYAASFKLPVLMMRSNNAYGPYQYPESTSLRPLSPFTQTMASPSHFVTFSADYRHRSSMCQ